MIRRRKRDDSAPAPPAPTPPAGVTGEPALGSPPPAVPTGDADESPSAAVLDELLAAFGVDAPTTLPRRRVDGTEPEAPVDAPAAPAADGGGPDAGATAESDAKPEAPGSAGDVPTMSTRAMSADELAASALAPPTGSPATTPSAIADPGTLVPEATKRSTRRSRREMRKEAKRAAKREARHAKEQAKQERKAAKARRKGGSPAPDDIGPGEGVRIVPADPARPSSGAPPGVVTPSGDGAPTAAGTRTVTVIADDDLPDPVYLEGDLAASEGETPARQRVFIDDRDPATGTMVSLEAATTAARMEPRLRERRAAVRRATSRKRLKWLAVVTMVVGVVVATLAVLGSGWFAIRDVDLQGAVYSRGDALDAIVDDVDGANVLRLDTGAIEQRFEAIPWVEDARVTTQFPHRARIEIRERRPTVTYQGADAGYRVLDDHGRVLDVVVGGRPAAYTEVMVTDGPNLAPGETAPAGYRAAAMLVQSLPAPLRALVASVSVDREGTDLRMELTNRVQVRFGPAQDLVDKIVRLQVALTNPNPDEAAPTQLIDVSTDDVILR